MPPTKLSLKLQRYSPKRLQSPEFPRVLNPLATIRPLLVANRQKIRANYGLVALK